MAKYVVLLFSLMTGRIQCHSFHMNCSINSLSLSELVHRGELILDCNASHPFKYCLVEHLGIDSCQYDWNSFGSGITLASCTDGLKSRIQFTGKADRRRSQCKVRIGSVNAPNDAGFWVVSARRYFSVDTFAKEFTIDANEECEPVPLPVRHDCYEPNVAYKDVALDYIPHVPSASRCQELCFHREGCHFWTWHDDGERNCALQDERAIAHRFYESGSYAGPKFCPNCYQFNRKVVDERKAFIGSEIIPDVFNCRQRCNFRSNGGCQFITWDEKRRKCSLFRFEGVKGSSFWMQDVKTIRAVGFVSAPAECFKAEWSEWSPWSECGKKYCGEADLTPDKRFRRRICNGLNNNARCKGPYREEERCLDGISVRSGLGQNVHTGKSSTLVIVVVVIGVTSGLLLIAVATFCCVKNENARFFQRVKSSLRRNNGIPLKEFRDFVRNGKIDYSTRYTQLPMTKDSFGPKKGKTIKMDDLGISIRFEAASKDAQNFVNSAIESDANLIVSFERTDEEYENIYDNHIAAETEFSNLNLDDVKPLSKEPLFMNKGDFSVLELNGNWPVSWYRITSGINYEDAEPFFVHLIVEIKRRMENYDDEEPFNILLQSLDGRVLVGILAAALKIALDVESGDDSVVEVDHVIAYLRRESGLQIVASLAEYRFIHNVIAGYLRRSDGTQDHLESEYVYSV